MYISTGVMSFLHWAINSFPPCAAYMRQWMGSVLVQIMACCLFSAKPLSKPMLGYYQLNFRNKLEWNLSQDRKLFIHENASENIVCEMAAILSRRRWVKRCTSSLITATAKVDSNPTTRDSHQPDLSFNWAASPSATRNLNSCTTHLIRYGRLNAKKT